MFCNSETRRAVPRCSNPPPSCSQQRWSFLVQQPAASRPAQAVREGARTMTGQHQGDGAGLDANLCMFCLGIVVGGVAFLGLNLVQNFPAAVKAAAIILPAALGGVVLKFIKEFQTKGAISGYCGGLCTALVWAFVKSAGDNISSPETIPRVLGCLTILGILLVSVVAAFLFVWPSVVQAYQTMTRQMAKKNNDPP